MKRNTRNKNNDMLKIVLIGVGAYLLYKHFKKPALPKATVTIEDPIMTSWNDKPLETWSPDLPQEYVDSPIDYYQVLRVNSDVLSGVKKHVGGLPLTI